MTALRLLIAILALAASAAAWSLNDYPTMILAGMFGIAFMPR